jgi:hypothetical protein
MLVSFHVILHTFYRLINEALRYEWCKHKKGSTLLWQTRLNSVLNICTALELAAAAPIF